MRLIHRLLHPSIILLFVFQIEMKCERQKHPLFLQPYTNSAPIPLPLPYFLLQTLFSNLRKRCGIMA